MKSELRTGPIAVVMAVAAIACLGTILVSLLLPLTGTEISGTWRTAISTVILTVIFAVVSLELWLLWVESLPGAKPSRWAYSAALVVLIAVLVGLAYWGLSHTIDNISGDHWGPDDIGAIIGGVTGLSGLVAGTSIAVSRLLRALGARAWDIGRGAQARNTGEAEKVRAQLEGEAAKIKAQAEGEAGKIRAQAELERVRAQTTWAHAQLERTRRGLPELPPPPFVQETAVDTVEQGTENRPSPNGNELSTSTSQPDGTDHS
ncbi:hypothetical protein [Streptomyces shaanxiensis]